MKISKLAIVAAAAGLLCGGQAFAQQPAGGFYPSLYRPAADRQVAYEYESYYAGQPTPAAPEPMSPSDVPPAADYGAATAHDHGNCCEPKCNTCCNERSRLFGAFLSGSYFWNPDDPIDRFNGPVTFNDRADELQLNQVYLYLDRAVDTGGSGWDLGGRVDALYGTDWRFTPALGFETNQDGTMDWNQDRRFYGMAIPQMYGQVGFNDLNVKIGRFYTIIGYEVVPANGNFFSTHAYTMQYGEPFTHTGVLGSYALTEALALTGGFTRGWDQWEDINNDISFLGGATWTPSDVFSLAFALSTGAEDPAGEANRYIHSIVASYKIGCNLTYVFQSDIGHQEGAAGFTPGGADAEWYGINQYLLYDINDRWSAGARGEWFRDDDGFRVAGFGSPGGDFFGRGWGGSGFAGNFYEISLGLNWKFRPRVLIRNEVRWDWYDGLPGVSNVPGNGTLPYDNGSDDDQFLLGTNVVLSY
ncbi:MAG: porin [Pirellulales bacterium]